VTTGNYAGGNPMVHLRAVPEGGPPGALGGVAVATNLPFTFYDRYTTGFARTIDRRQPLPSVFAPATFRAVLETSIPTTRSG